MDIFQQFQVFLGSIVLGMLFLCLWSLFNAFFYKCRKSIVRLPFETLLFVAMVYLYHLFLVEITDGVLNIFYPLALFIGCYIYQKFYSPYINPVFNRWVRKIAKMQKSLLNWLKKNYNNFKKNTKRRKKHARAKKA